jgi:hypothetical protein
MLTREEAQQVLDALCTWELMQAQTTACAVRIPAIETLRARLKQSEPEPLAWLVTEDGKPVFLKGDKTPAAHVAKRKPNRKLIPLYAGAA